MTKGLIGRPNISSINLGNGGDGGLDGDQVLLGQLLGQGTLLFLHDGRLYLLICIAS